MSLPQQVIGTGISGATAAGSAMAVVPAPYDSALYSLPAANTQAIVTFPATVGKRWLLHSFVATLLNLGVGTIASASQLEIVIGVTRVFLTQLGVNAVSGTIDKLTMFNLAYTSGINQALVIDFLVAGGANTYQSISAAAYLI